MTKYKYLDPNKDLNDYSFSPNYEGGKHRASDLRNLPINEQRSLKREWWEAYHRQERVERLNETLSNTFPFNRWPFKRI